MAVDFLSHVSFLMGVLEIIFLKNLRKGKRGTKRIQILFCQLPGEACLSASVNFIHQ